MTKSRMENVISSNKLGDCSPWEMPVVGEKSQMLATSKAKLEALENQMRDEAHKKGHAEGLAAGQAEAKQYVDSILQTLNLLNEPMKLLDEQIEKKIMELVVALTKRCVAHEINAKPDLILKIVKEVTEMVPFFSKESRLYLNTEDAAVLNKMISKEQISASMPNIVEDTSLSRGEVRLVTGVIEIDATVASKITTIAERLLDAEPNE